MSGQWKKGLQEKRATFFQRISYKKGIREAENRDGAEAKEKLYINGEKVIDIHSHQPGGTKGGAGNDFNLTEPNRKNAVYMKDNGIQTDRKGMLYEYTQKQSRVKSVPILNDDDLLRYIKSN